MTEENIRVLIVDDDAIVRSAMSAYVSAADDLEVVGLCENGQVAIDRLSETDVDVVVMDIRMPVLDGITAAGRIREQYPEVKVLLLTSFDEDDYARNALQGGASGFLLKDASPKAVVDAVHAVHEGSTVVSPEPMKRLLRQSGSATAAAGAGGRIPRDVDLSIRELDILQLLCRAKSNAEIAQDLYLSESTVKTHVSAIMSKLMVNSRLKAVVRAYEWGLVDRA